MNRLLILLFLGILSVQLSAQFNYERYYTPNFRDHVTKDITAIRSGGYFILNQNYIAGQDTSYAVNIGSYTVKGDILGSNDYVYGDSLLIRRANNMQLLNNEGLLLSTTLDTSSQNKVVSYIDPQGDVIWSNAYGTIDSFPTLFSANYNAGVIALDSTFFHFNYANDSFMTAMYLSPLDTITGMPLWERTYNYIDTIGNTYNEEWGNLISNREEGFSACGRLEGEDNAAFIMAIDSMGTLEFARVYRDSSDLNLHMRFNDIIQLADSSYLCVGHLQEELSDNTNSVIAKMDSIGNLIWAKRINDSVSGSNTITEFTQRGSETVVTIKSRSVVGVSFIALMGISPEGDINWQTQYKSIIASDFERKSTVSNNNNELAIAVTGVSDLTTQVPYLIVAGFNGETLCSVETQRYSVEDLTIEVDTANFVLDTFASQVITIPLRTFSFNSYDIPFSALETINLCPDQANPIDTLVDATVEGAVSYKWSTGETTAMINVTEEEQYNVEITFDTDVCFTLCDTFDVSVIALPAVTIDSNIDQYCTSLDRPIILEANPSTQPQFTYIWTGGADDRAIEVNGIGTYAVTVTDGCGETASSSISINSQDVPQVDETDFFTNILNCFSPQVDITLTSTGDLTSYTGVVWTNEAGDTIAQDVSVLRVDEAGTYTVTGIDDCLYDFTQVTTVSPESFNGTLAPNFSSGDNTVCKMGPYQIVLNNFSDFSSVQWPDGQNDIPEITVENPGDYEIILIDECGDAQSFTVTVLDEDSPESPEPIFTSADNTPCKMGPYQIVLNNFSDFSTVQWPDGQNNVESINVESPGDYVITLLDKCDISQTATVTVLDEDTPAFVDPILTLDTVAFCINTFATISLNNAAIYDDIIWNDGTSESSIQVDQDGSYTVNLVDQCGNEGQGSIAVNGLEDCDEGCLKFPNLVITNSNVEDSKVFKPVSRCIGEITNYSLKIFNRWGKLIFESNNPDEAWDASFNGNPIQGDVYLFYSNYSVDGTENEAKGDITVLK